MKNEWKNGVISTGCGVAEIRRMNDGCIIMYPGVQNGSLFPHRIDESMNLADQIDKINSLFASCYKKGDFRNYFKSVHKSDPKWDTRLSDEEVMRRSIWIRKLQEERRCNI